MEKTEILQLLKEYGVEQMESFEEINSTNGEDFRLNIMIDKKYVLRINQKIMTEERLREIAELSERYCEIGILAPRLYKNRQGNYLTPYGEYICYLSDYLDFPLLEGNGAGEEKSIRDEIITSIGVFSKKFTGVHLCSTPSMWTMIDLHPMDDGIDEKQENLNLLTDKLNEIGEKELAEKIQNFNTKKREQIGAVYKELPRCMIQGDLNDTNILINEGHFMGLIDFNMAGTEVNINHFCCETNGWLEQYDFINQGAEELYQKWTKEQERQLQLILKEYELNALEQEYIGDYRSIIRLSQYPNVMTYIAWLSKDKEKTKSLLELILKEGES